MTSTPRRATVALAVFFVALFTAGAVGAQSTTSTIPRNDNHVMLVRGIGTVSGSPDGFTDVPGAKAVLQVAQGEVLFGSFSTAISCSGPEVATFCDLRLVAVNEQTHALQVLQPGPMRFDSVTGPDDDFEAHAADFSTDPLPAGVYTVKVQYTAREPQQKSLAVATLCHWHLRVERLAA